MLKRIVFLMLSSLCFSATLWGQQDEAPLGDVARQARRARPSQPHAKKTVSNEDSPPASAQAYPEPASAEELREEEYLKQERNICATALGSQPGELERAKSRGDSADKLADMEKSQQEMRETCSKIPPPRELRKPPFDACSLLATKELEDLLNIPVPFPPHPNYAPGGATSCDYTATWSSMKVDADHTCLKLGGPCDGHDRSPNCMIPSERCASARLLIQSAPVLQNGRDMWQEQIGRTTIYQARPGIAVPVSGVGDEANRVQGERGLNVRKDDRYLVVQLIYEPLNRKPTPEDRTLEQNTEIAIARRLLARLPSGRVDTYVPPPPPPDPRVVAEQEQRKRDAQRLRDQHAVCRTRVELLYAQRLDILKKAHASQADLDALEKDHATWVDSCNRAPLDRNWEVKFPQ